MAPPLPSIQLTAPHIVFATDTRLVISIRARHFSCRGRQLPAKRMRRNKDNSQTTATDEPAGDPEQIVRRAKTALMAIGGDGGGGRPWRTCSAGRG